MRVAETLFGMVLALVGVVLILLSIIGQGTWAVAGAILLAAAYLGPAGAGGRRTSGP